MSFFSSNATTHEPTRKNTPPTRQALKTVNCNPSYQISLKNLNLALIWDLAGVIPVL